MTDHAQIARSEARLALDDRAVLPLGETLAHAQVHATLAVAQQLERLADIAEDDSVRRQGI